MSVKQIGAVFCLMEGREIVEAYDTRYEAEAAMEPYRRREALEKFDRSRNWKSLWDVENRK